MRLMQKQLGVGLIEVMVALLILSISLLAIASLQTRSLQYNQSAYWRSQANILAYDLLDRMRANRTDLEDYSLAFGADAPLGGGLASEDLSAWLADLERLLPQGEGSITCAEQALAAPASAVDVCTVSIRWIEEHIFGEVDDADLDDEVRTTFTYTTSI